MHTSSCMREEPKSRARPSPVSQAGCLATVTTQDSDLALGIPRGGNRWRAGSLVRAAARPGAGRPFVQCHDAEQKKSFVSSAGPAGPPSSPCCRRNAERDPHVFRPSIPSASPAALSVGFLLLRPPPWRCSTALRCCATGWMAAPRADDLGNWKKQQDESRGASLRELAGRRTEVAFVDRAGALPPPLAPSQAGRRPTAAGAAGTTTTTKQAMAGLGWAHGALCVATRFRACCPAAGAAPAGKERCVAGQCDLLKFAAYWLAACASVAPWPVLGSVVGRRDRCTVSAGSSWHGT